MGHHVLIVDDDKTSCLFIRHCLDERGYLTHEAHDGRQALALAEVCEPACIVLDCHLGETESGFELIDPLMRRAPLAPIIMISADPSWGWAAKALGRGAFVYWRKTMSPMELVNAVGMAMDEYAVRKAGGPAARLNDLNDEEMHHLSIRTGGLSPTASDLSRRAASLPQLMRDLRRGWAVQVDRTPPRLSG